MNRNKTFEGKDNTRFTKSEFLKWGSFRQMMLHLDQPHINSDDSDLVPERNIWITENSHITLNFTYSSG